MLKPYKECQKFIIFFISIISFEFSKGLDCATNCIGSSSGISCSNLGSNTCPTGCNQKFGSRDCYDCSGITGKYYTIDSSRNCLNQCLGDKIIGRTDNTPQECTYVSVPSSYYKLGDVYYYSAPSTTTCTSHICSCSSYYYLEILDGKKIYTCFSSINGASTSSYLYYNYKTMQFFENGCPDGFNVQKEIFASPTNVKRCSDKCINNEFLISIETSGIVNDYCIDTCDGTTYSGYNIIYIDNGVKKCLSVCPSGMYKDDSASECKTLDDCVYYYGTTCYSSCPTSSPSMPYHNHGSKLCISDCPTSGDYIYKKDPDDHICYRKEDCDYIRESGTTYTCLSSCGTGEFHDNNSKLCKSYCGQENTNKIYFANDGNTCYLSCAEIPGEYIYESLDNADGHGNKICYKEATSCDYFYRKVNGIMKCITLEDCINNLHYKYLVEGECKNSCDGYYQIELKTTGSPQYSYKKCFFTIGDALEDSDVNFCDTSQGKCWTTFPDVNSYFIKSQFDSTSKYEITRQCENFYYEDANPIVTSQSVNWCTNDCMDTSTQKYFVNGNKKCLSSCSDVFKYYYDGDNNECLDSCELRSNKQFSILATASTPQECLASCSSSTNRL